MSQSYAYTDAVTFTETHARHIAAKVAADLKRMQRFYGAPSDSHIAELEAEMISFLKAGYLKEITYGFRRDSNWINPTLRYTARELAGASADDNDPGRVLPGSDTTNASFYSYLIYSAAWDNLSESAKETFKANSPVQRTGAGAPGVAGYFVQDRTYSAGGRALDRQSVRSWQ